MIEVWWYGMVFLPPEVRRGPRARGSATHPGAEPRSHEMTLYMESVAGVPRMDFWRRLGRPSFVELYLEGVFAE